jgi:hypothetical protein
VTLLPIRELAAWSLALVTTDGLFLSV